MISFCRWRHVLVRHEWLFRFFSIESIIMHTHGTSIMHNWRLGARLPGGLRYHLSCKSSNPLLLCSKHSILYVVTVQSCSILWRQLHNEALNLGTNHWPLDRVHYITRFDSRQISSRSAPTHGPVAVLPKTEPVALKHGAGKRNTEHLSTPAPCVCDTDLADNRKEGNLSQCVLKVRNGHKASQREQLELGCSFGSSPFRRALRVMRQNTESSPGSGPPPIDSSALIVRPA